MLSIGFLAQKGGAGKTTLAVHLAVLAGDALLVDLDPQRSAAEWWETRSAELPELEDARTVASLVDLVVIPTRPAILDLRAIRATVEIISRAGARAVVVLNACPVARTVAEASIVTEARQALASYGLPLAPMAVAQRAALSYALNDGRAVSEFEPDGKAAKELRRLWEWLHVQAIAPTP